GKSVPNSPIVVDTNIGATTETNADVPDESPTKLVLRHMVCQVPQHMELRQMWCLMLPHLWHRKTWWTILSLMRVPNLRVMIKKLFLIRL
ncbi:hypothetical protein L195_g062340, partial [Trifolium pratense]